ncbi:integrase [Azospirillum palustre]|uniref:Integrase n=1 Tax=Azospirillum palustre TaxID=2044885 RepID=A0A2B8BF15_9PROT|nr:site-specific integrase [Azospirillum palustre]PGH56511.1 integrase [Azospirillum palustre]
MPRKAAGLTARKVETIKTPGLFADGNGLYLQVTASGARSWIYRFAMSGRRRDMGLGSAIVVSLAQARDKAIEAKKLVAAGVDPLEARKAQAAAQVQETAKAATFKECAVDYIASMKAGWKNAKHGAQWIATLETYAFPTLGALPVAAIDTPLVLQVLQPIWTTKTETASRLRGRIESVLDFAKVTGLRSGENPARWKGHLDLILPAKAAVAKVEHHASVPYSDMPALWPRLQVQDGASARALEFTILTAARTGEALGAKWSEIDLGARTWTIPGERMKAGVTHRVPLTDPALALLKKMAAIQRGEFVFEGMTTGKPLSNMSMAMVLRRMKVDATPHGFRSTFRTWAAECTSTPHEVAEAALAHTQGDKVVAAYQRGDLFEKRRALMEGWAAFLSG